MTCIFIELLDLVVLDTFSVHIRDSQYFLHQDAICYIIHVMKYIQLYNLPTYHIFSKSFSTKVPLLRKSLRVSPAIFFSKRAASIVLQKLIAIGIKTATLSNRICRAQHKMKMWSPDLKSGNKLVFSSVVSLLSCRGIFWLVFNVVILLAPW